MVIRCPSSTMERLEGVLERALNPVPRGSKPAPKPVRPEDVDVIREFVFERFTTDGIEIETARVDIHYLCVFSREITRPFKQMTTGDILMGVSKCRARFKPNSLRRLLSLLRRFSQWLVEDEVNPDIDLEKITRIKPPKIQLETKKASQMLTGGEVAAVIRAAKNSRDRAMLAMLYESACRPIELVEAAWGDLVFDRYGAQFTTDRKTGKPRYIRLIWSAPYLLEWKNDSPGGTGEGDPLFVSLRGAPTPLTRSGLKQAVYAAAEHSGVEKNVFPYLFRHSRITAMIVDEVPDSIVKMQCWGDLNSRMLAAYAHIAPKDIDRILLGRAGIEVEEHGQTDLQPQQCPHCGTRNGPIDNFCRECGAGLNVEAVREKEEVAAGIMERFEEAEDAPEWLRKLVRAEVWAERERGRRNSP